MLNGKAFERWNGSFRGTLDLFMWFDALSLVTIMSNGKGIKQ